MTSNAKGKYTKKEFSYLFVRSNLLSNPIDSAKHNLLRSTTVKGNRPFKGE